MRPKKRPALSYQEDGPKPQGIVPDVPNEAAAVWFLMACMPIARMWEPPTAPKFHATSYSEKGDDLAELKGARPGRRLQLTGHA